MPIMTSGSKIFPFLVVALLVQRQQADAYKILVIPLPCKSHVFALSAIANELVNRGHQVSFMASEHFPLNDPEVRNRSSINVVRYVDSVRQNSTAGSSSGDAGAVDFDAFFETLATTTLERKDDFVGMMPRLKTMLNDQCHFLTMENEPLMKQLEKEKFDLAVVDGIFYMKCVYLIPHRLGIPWVTYCDTIDPFIVRSPWLPSFVPHLISPFTERMTFVERLKNTATNVAFSRNLLFPDPPRSVLQRFQKYGRFRNLDDLMARSLVWFITKDNVLDYATPMMPNMVNVGGLTIKTQVEELPKNFGEFVDGAERGAVLVTFGAAASTLPAEIVRKFASAFRRLDGYRVVWRLNNKFGVELPDNVMTVRWLPQNDILANKNVKLFITHCGNNGQFEAVYHAVPMIGFPYITDQFHNAARIQYKGFGISMDFNAFTSDQLLENIHKVLANGSSYANRISKASEIFRSQSQGPVERAVFWIEHVCKFGGDHLKSAGNELPLHEYLLLDILAFVLAVVFVIFYLIVKTIILAWRLCKTPVKVRSKNVKLD